ncbi:MAG: magnesium/cobalt transporter CorA [Calditrichales bacterium]|nr:MAG: magnesium/cobalt transporter CorA [Calditrichales bacterium]
MARFFKKRHETAGQIPGTPVFVGNKKQDKILVRMIDYNASDLQERTIADIEQLEKYPERDSVTWVNIDGLHDVDFVRKISEIFNLHQLVSEDIVNTGQRPKLDEYDNALFIVVKMLMYDEAKKLIKSEQLSLLIMEKVLLTFQERTGDFFEPVRERIRKQKGRIRSFGTDYLAYALLDTVVDNYIYLVERMGEEIEDLEVSILADPKPGLLDNINYYKREMNFIRKAIRPFREFLIRLNRIETELITPVMVPFLKDLEDLIMQVTEGIESYREMLSDQLNIYHTSVSNRMNDIMKVLTIFAAIFIPLTFIAGVYGTNFEYVPELRYRFAYPVFLGVMATIAWVMIYFFRRKKWL